MRHLNTSLLHRDIAYRLQNQKLANSRNIYHKVSKSFKIGVLYMPKAESYIKLYSFLVFENEDQLYELSDLLMNYLKSGSQGNVSLLLEYDDIELQMKNRSYQQLNINYHAGKDIRGEYVESATFELRADSLTATVYIHNKNTIDGLQGAFINQKLEDGGIYFIEGNEELAKILNTFNSSELPKDVPEGTKLYYCNAVLTMTK